MKLIENKKGFIGSIGDDLPSLIPIFLGLVVFFSVFLNVFNDYNTKNSLFNLNQEAIEISMQLKSDPVIIDYEHFIEKCNTINTTKNWNAFLINLPLNVENFEFINLDTIRTNHQGYVINEENPDIAGFFNYFICDEDNLSEIDITSDKIISYLYPITLQRESGDTSPARLYILIWE